MKGIRLSRRGDLDALREIWNASFPGDEAFADWFLERVYRPERALVWTEGGRAGAMLHLIPVSYHTGGEDLPAAYVYAVATLPTHRGRGIASALLEAGAEVERGRGSKLLTLVPQSGGLFEYYRRQGFSDALFRARRVLAAGPEGTPGGLELDDAPEPAGMRALFEAVLRGRDFLVRPEADWARSLTYLRAVGARRDGRLAGYAVYEPGGSVRELIAPDDETRRALEAAALRRLNVPEAVAFGPDGPREPYGMARALETGLEIRGGYAGLMLD